MRTRRVRPLFAALVAAMLLPLNATVLLGCKSYDELKKEMETAGVPLVDSIVPPAGKPGTVVTLRGVAFGATQGKVGFQDANGNIAVSEIVSWNSDFIVTKVPSLAGNPATSLVHLVTYDGKSLAFPSNFTMEK